VKKAQFKAPHHLLLSILMICLMLFSISDLYSQTYFEQITLPVSSYGYVITYHAYPLPAKGCYLIANVGESSSYPGSWWEQLYQTSFGDFGNVATLRYLPIGGSGWSTHNTGAGTLLRQYFLSPEPERTILSYSNQHYPEYADHQIPNAKVLDLSESSGIIDTVLMLDSVEAPITMRGTEGKTHLIWESIGRWDQSGNHAGAIYGCSIDADGHPTTRVLIDSGYFPQVVVDSTGMEHIVYFSAERPSGLMYSLKYARCRNDKIDTIIVLRRNVQISVSSDAWISGYYKYNTFSVRQDGRCLHVGWVDLNACIYLLQYDASGIKVDSIQKDNSVYNLKFLFREGDNKVFVMWFTQDSALNAHRYYSDNLAGSLFAEVKVLPEAFKNWQYEFFLDPPSQVPVFMYLTSDSGFHFTTDFANGTDDGFIRIPNALRFTQLVIDQANNIYALYLDTLGISHLIHFFSISTGVSGGKSSLPASFALSQNYPNPFNPATMIYYQLPNESQVHLSIFNVLGQQVRTLVNATEQPGEKSIQFDASGLPSGIYFYRLDASSISDPTKHFSQTRKMVLVK
jgi:hypothetical protein